MKQLIILALLLAKTLVGISQYTDSSQRFAGHYLVKSRLLKTGAVVLTVAGSIGLLAALAAHAGNGIVSAVSGEPTPGTSMGPIMLGTVALVGAIPLFVEAKKNKQKYYLLSGSFKMETRPNLHRSTINPITYPALSLKVQLK